MSTTREKPARPAKEKSGAGSGSGSKPPKAAPEKLALKGSSKMVSEFFEYSINSILYQRGVYPADDFITVKKYGLPMSVASDDQVKAYIRKIMAQLHRWMLKGKISKLVVVITEKDSGEHVERWQFDVDLLPAAAPATAPATATSDENGSGKPAAAAAAPAATEKTTEQIQAEISHLFRQITSSVTFLPVLTAQCTFNVLVYADADSDVPVEWGDSDAKEIKNGEKVQLRSFSTANHRVGATVSYRMDD